MDVGIAIAIVRCGAGVLRGMAENRSLSTNSSSFVRVTLVCLRCVGTAILAQSRGLGKVTCCVSLS
jgi:hypothetical protein